MTDCRLGLTPCALGVVLLALAACGKGQPPQVEPIPPNPAIARVAIAAAADLNPDAVGRPSPVVLRVYQLKGDAAFSGAEFFLLFDDEARALGAELISRTEIVLDPDEQRTLELAVDPEAGFIGAAASFRDIRNAEWRAVVPTWREGTRDVAIDVSAARVHAYMGEVAPDEVASR